MYACTYTPKQYIQRLIFSNHGARQVNKKGNKARDTNRPTAHSHTLVRPSMGWAFCNILKDNGVFNCKAQQNICAKKLILIPACAFPK